MLAKTHIMVVPTTVAKDNIYWSPTAWLSLEEATSVAPLLAVSSRKLVGRLDWLLSGANVIGLNTKSVATLLPALDAEALALGLTLLLIGGVAVWMSDWGLPSFADSCGGYSSLFDGSGAFGFSSMLLNGGGGGGWSPFLGNSGSVGLSSTGGLGSPLGASGTLGLSSAGGLGSTLGASGPLAISSAGGRGSPLGAWGGVASSSAGSVGLGAGLAISVRPPLSRSCVLVGIASSSKQYLSTIG